jgi:putative flavoprotein involved in K+ transport
VRTTVVVIGAGHSGLAVSRRLTERSIDHVVIERGEVANSWRTERWESLRLLTPNWLTNLPGLPYPGDQPDGYMTAADLATHIGDYAATIDAPVHTRTTVMRVRAGSCGYHVVTNRGYWQCAALVIASGPCNTARLPLAAASLPPTIDVRTAMDYRSPAGLAKGGVLVVGASATGVQLAEEIHHSGRPVTLAVGEHVRMPRTYRGRDIFWWTDASATLDERYDEVDDLVRARGLPSPQLIGSSDRRSIDINHLAGEGITIVGRLGRITGGRAQFSGSLTNTCALADLKMNRLLDRLDTWAQRTDADVDPPERFRPTQVSRPLLEVDLRRSGISTVLFATGFRPDYSWLDLPVLDQRSRIVHDGGVITGAPGCYVVGLNILRRRRSSYISGAERDSADIARLLHRHLDVAARSTSRVLPSTRSGRSRTVLGG